MNRYNYKVVGEENNNLDFTKHLLRETQYKGIEEKTSNNQFLAELERNWWEVKEDAWRREKARGIEEFWYMVDGVTLTMGVAGSKLEKALGDHFPEGERYFGLENFGNTCYCNSVLQVVNLEFPLSRFSRLCLICRFFLFFSVKGLLVSMWV